MKTLSKITFFVESKKMYLLSLKNILFNSFRNYYYSQTGEDIILEKIFSKKDGFYVDVGAYHPVHYSNTKKLYDKGWSGINIDPNPDTIFFFNKYRRNDINLNLGVSREDKTIEYYMFSHPACNTFSKDFFEKMNQKKWIKHIKTLKVKCRTLCDILDEFVPLNKKIDVMTIDVEGFDLDVLESNDWLKYSPEVVVVEGHGFSFENMAEYPIYSFLVDKNYYLHAFTGLSLVFKLK